MTVNSRVLPTTIELPSHLLVSYQQRLRTSINQRSCLKRFEWIRCAEGGIHRKVGVVYMWRSEKLPFFSALTMLVVGAFVANLSGQSMPALTAYPANPLVNADNTPPPSIMQLVQESRERTVRRPEVSSLLRQSSQRSSFLTLRAFRDAIGDAWRSTVRIMDGDDQIAFGAVVHADGFVVTKASQLSIGRSLVCELSDERRSKIEIVANIEVHDVALLRIGYKGLTPVQWESPYSPQRGKWLATSSMNPTPVAVGVVSAGFQKVPKRRPILGVSLVDSSMGTSISQVVRGSGGDIAGLKVGDVIKSINGKPLANKDSIIEEIKSFQAGQTIYVEIIRNQRDMEIAARVMDLAEEMWDDPTEVEVNGSISHRSTGYPRVFLHDTVLLPNQCGGPLVNLDGRVVGINIARAGRVTSYAIPAEVVNSILDERLPALTSKVVPTNAVQTNPQGNEVR